MSGWGWPSGARRWHYFATDGKGSLRSLCGTYGWWGDGADLKPDEGPDNDDCRACARRLRKEED